MIGLKSWKLLGGVILDVDVPVGREVDAHVIVHIGILDPAADAAEVVDVASVVTAAPLSEKL